MIEEKTTQEPEHGDGANGDEVASFDEVLELVEAVWYSHIPNLFDTDPENFPRDAFSELTPVTRRLVELIVSWWVAEFQENGRILFEDARSWMKANPDVLLTDEGATALAKEITDRAYQQAGDLLFYVTQATAYGSMEEGQARLAEKAVKDLTKGMTSQKRPFGSPEGTPSPSQPKKTDAVREFGAPVAFESVHSAVVEASESQILARGKAPDDPRKVSAAVDDVLRPLCREIGRERRGQKEGQEEGRDKPQRLRVSRPWTYLRKMVERIGGQLESSYGRRDEWGKYDDGTTAESQLSENDDDDITAESQFGKKSSDIPNLFDSDEEDSDEEEKGDIGTIVKTRIGAMDLDQYEGDRRAARRLERGGGLSGWHDRNARVSQGNFDDDEGSPEEILSGNRRTEQFLDVECESTDKKSWYDRATRYDKEYRHTFGDPIADQEHEKRDPALYGNQESKELFETLMEFYESEADAKEKELLEALFEYGTPGEALEAIGDEENWSRWQSLQRKLKRRDPRG